MTTDSALIVSRSGGGEWSVTDTLVIGRDPTCDVFIDDRQVSRRHAVVRRTDDGYVLTDEGSKNGTWVNGAAVTGPTRLQDGDELSIAARLKLYFVDAEATAPLVFEGRGVRIDPETLAVYVNGAELDPPLSGPQWELVRLLHDADGALVSRDDIVAHVWPEEEARGVSEDAVDALIRRVRMRLAEVEPDHQFIVTLRGYGFRLDNP